MDVFLFFVIVLTCMAVVKIWNELVEKRVPGGVFTKGKQEPDVTFVPQSEDEEAYVPSAGGRYEVRMHPWSPDYSSEFRTHVKWMVKDLSKGQVRQGHVRTDAPLSKAVEQAKAEAQAAVRSMKEAEKFADVRYTLD